MGEKERGSGQREREVEGERWRDGGREGEREGGFREVQTHRQTDRQTKTDIEKQRER